MYSKDLYLFTIYLARVSVAQTTALNDWMISAQWNGKYVEGHHGLIWGPYWHLPGGAEENYEELNQYSRYPREDSHSEHPEYKSDGFALDQIFLSTY
jgi:hypothetical protein